MTSWSGDGAPPEDDQDARPDEGAPGEEGAGAPGPEGPRPSTWAGRSRAAGEDAETPQGEEEPASEPESGEEAESGPLTQELEKLHAELRDELTSTPEAGEVAEPEPPPADGEPGVEEDQKADESPEAAEDEKLTLGDREAARDAALAGLRARAAKTGVSKQTPPVAPPAAAAGPAAAPPSQPGAPAPVGDAGTPTGSNRGLWARFVAASLLIVVSMATATAVSLLVYLTDIAKGLGDLKGVKSQLSLADASDPQTILILGSDQRPNDTSARSDTTILLRVTPEQINLLSIPRDLKVNIPGFGTDKLNAAYSYGGPRLTVKTIKQLIPQLEINHVVNVDFTGFADAVDAIDCVYIDVDHHYYHSNLGLAASEQYSEIDVPAGYQRMCGYKALQYVRYRHEDNDLVRSARQQSFLREARQAVPTSKLLNPFSDKRNQLIDIFTKYTTSDIDSGKTLIGLLKLFLKARNAQVREIHFPANIGGPTSTYVTASQPDIQKAVSEFLGVTPPPQPAPVPEKKPSGGNGGGGPSKPPPPPPMDDSSSMGLDYAGRLAATKTKAGKPMLDFPILYPTRLVPGSLISDDSRAFPIDGPGSAEYRGYKMVMTLGGAYTQYYGISGTDWKDPPILDNPSEERVIGGRNYLLFYDGGRLRQVGWKTEKASYWVSNTLVQSLSEPQLLAIAESMREFNG